MVHVEPKSYEAIQDEAIAATVGITDPAVIEQKEKEIFLPKMIKATELCLNSINKLCKNNPKAQPVVQQLSMMLMQLNASAGPNPMQQQAPMGGGEEIVTDSTAVVDSTNTNANVQK